MLALKKQVIEEVRRELEEERREKDRNAERERLALEAKRQREAQVNNIRS